MKFNVENSDILMMNGSLQLVYHTDKMDTPMTMIISNSYHDLNEKAMGLFGDYEWAENVIEWSLHGESPVWHNLLADIYKNHHEVYKSLVYDSENDDAGSDDICVSLTLTGEVDEETGHRLARFNEADLNQMDTDDLIDLADAFEVYEPYMMRHEIIEALVNEDIDIDDCDDEDKDDECDCCDCEEDEHPNARLDAPQYEAVNGPDHYNGTQCIEQMRHLYGDDAVRWFCICNAYKYRFRKGHKPGVDAEQDEQKARWYEDYASNMMSDQRYY